jgi:hypothetical protein
MTPRLRKMAGKIKRRLAATFRRRPGLEFSGNYATWAAAQNASTGYDSATILEKCKNALLKVKNAEVAYERDSVVFDKVEYSWPVLAALLRAGVENNGKALCFRFRWVARQLVLPESRISQRHKIIAMGNRRTAEFRSMWPCSISLIRS